MCQHSFTRKWDKQIRVFERKNNQEALEKKNEALRILSLNPRGESKRLKGNLSGKRSHREGNYRVIFAYCKECRELGDFKYNKCKNCEIYPDHNLFFFNFDNRGHSYKNR